LSLAAQCKLTRVFDPFLSYFGLLRDRDPNDCFQWISEQDNILRKALDTESVIPVFFFLAGGTAPVDGLPYLRDFRTTRLLRELKAIQARIGLHSSYSAGQYPERIIAEKTMLE
jgi:hypothetical protein